MVFTSKFLISYTMHVFLTGYDSMLSVTLITIVGAMMVHVFCPGGCLWTNAMARFARLIFSFLRAAQKRASPAKTAGFRMSFSTSGLHHTYRKGSIKDWIRRSLDCGLRC